jgi:homoserine dehydrogenase
MKEHVKVKIGLLGLGVVGSVLVSLIRQNVQRIEHETGISVEIEKVFVRSAGKKRDIDLNGLSLTTNISEIIEDPDIDIICECMGGSGYKETFEFLQTAMKNKKHVILSSKKALAEYAEQLLFTAYINRVHLKYDATVGGGIPIAKVLENAFKGDKLLRISGIFNATSNFIYTKMSSDNQSFGEALKIAQEKGYAENDPADDVDGIDSTNKLIILSLFGLNKIIRRSDLHPESFTRIEIRDMHYANELGYRIKPVATISGKNDTVDYYVGPYLVPSIHIIANTFNNNNTIVLEGEHCGELAFYGEGAGSFPTASAMFDDLVNILSAEKVQNEFPFTKVDNINITNSPAKYYWRFTVKNETGILASITRVLAMYNINIERLIQKNAVEGGIELVLLTSNVNSKISVIEALGLSGIKCQAVIPYL